MVKSRSHALPKGINMIRQIICCLAAAFVLSGTAVAQDTKQVPDSMTEIQVSFAPLVKQSANAVVNVYADKRVTPFYSHDPFFEEFFGQQMPNRTEKQSSLGSGVII